MSITMVKEYLKQYGKDQEVKEFHESSATVELAAAALGVEPARIAKTLSFYGEEDGACALVVAAGDVKVDNAKFKQFFGRKAKMIGGDDVERMTGHEPGGVCPFANPPRVTAYLDVSLQRFATVFPACGSPRSAIEMTCDELFCCSHAAGWIDVCKRKEG